MASKKPIKKKVITAKTIDQMRSNRVKFSPKNKVRSRKSLGTREIELSFGKKNYQLVILGAILILLGMMLMSGGSMPSPDVWDESEIYSFRRITLAPVVIVCGLIVEIFAIFRSK